MLMVMVYAGGHISGCSLTTLRFRLQYSFVDRIKAGEMIQYWVVQIIGGIVGALLSYYVMGGNPGAVHHAPGDNVSTTVALLAEIVATFCVGVRCIKCCHQRIPREILFMG
jgi:aquaporin Z